MISLWSSTSTADVWYCEPWKTVELKNAEANFANSSKAIMQVKQNKVTIKKRFATSELNYSYTIIASQHNRLTALDDKSDFAEVGTLLFNQEDKLLILTNTYDTFAEKVYGNLETYRCSEF